MFDKRKGSLTPARRSVIKSIGGVGFGAILTSGTASAQSEEVEVLNLELNPNTIDGSDTTHTLTFEIKNISADSDNSNSEDTITIALPDCIDVTSAEFSDEGPFDPKPNPLEEANPITFTVDPDNPVDDPVTMKINLQLSPTNSCYDETDDNGDNDDEDASDPPGCPDLPLSFTNKTFEFTEFEDFTDFAPQSVEVPSEYVDRAFGRQATISQRFIGIKFPPAFSDRGDFEVGFQITAGFLDTIDEVVDFQDFNDYTEVTDQYDRSDDARIFDNPNEKRTLNIVYKSTNSVDHARVSIVPNDFDYFEDTDCPNGAQSVYEKAVNTIGPAE